MRRSLGQGERAAVADGHDGGQTGQVLAVGEQILAACAEAQQVLQQLELQRRVASVGVVQPESLQVGCVQLGHVEIIRA